MENPTTSYTAVERLICKLRDVRSCGIRVDADGSIAAVHVTARAGRPAKQIARDVEAILSAEEGLAVDHRKISVAQYEGASAPAETIPRIAIGGVSLHQSTGQCEADVLLVAGELQATGHGTGSNTQFEVRRVVASATPYATRYVRFGPSVANTEDDVDRALAASPALPPDPGERVAGRSSEDMR